VKNASNGWSQKFENSQYDKHYMKRFCCHRDYFILFMQLCTKLIS